MESIDALERIVNEIPAQLKSISRSELLDKPAPNRWSKIQILGHLVDSAANNHQRFVRIQTEETPVIWYDQNIWNDAGHYQTLDKDLLIDLWEKYNRLLLHIIQNISPSKLNRLGFSGQPETHTLAWYIDDYVIHMKHHLDQILAHAA